MLASELRDKLNELIKEKGDLPVFDSDCSLSFNRRACFKSISVC